MEMRGDGLPIADLPGVSMINGFKIILNWNRPEGLNEEIYIHLKTGPHVNSLSIMSFVRARLRVFLELSLYLEKDDP